MPVPVEPPAGMNTSASTPGTSRAQRVDRLGALQRQQRLVVHEVERDLVGQMLEQMGDIVIFGRAVDDHVEPVLPAREHQIVEDAAILGEQQRIAGRRAHARHVGRHQRLERLVERRRREVSWPMWLTSNSPAIRASRDARP